MLAKCRGDFHLIRLDSGADLFLEVANAKIVILLGKTLIFPLVIWANSTVFLTFFFSDEAFATLAIPAIILSAIDMWLELLPDFLARSYMFRVCGANKIGI